MSATSDMRVTGEMNMRATNDNHSKTTDGCTTIEHVSSEVDEVDRLGTIFTEIVEDSKGVLPLYEEFISTTAKLSTSFSSTLSTLQTLVHLLQRIANSAFCTAGRNTDVGVCLGQVCEVQSGMAEHLDTMACLVEECCTKQLGGRVRQWREDMVKLENDHEKDFSKIKTLLKKKKESIGKLEKKLKNGKQEPELCKLRDNMLKDMRSRCEIFVDQEKMAVREISCQERTQYTTFSACLKSVLSEEFEMLSKAALLNEVMGRVTSRLNLQVTTSTAFILILQIIWLQQFVQLPLWLHLLLPII